MSRRGFLHTATLGIASVLVDRSALAQPHTRPATERSAAAVHRPRYVDAIDPKKLGKWISGSEDTRGQVLFGGSFELTGPCRGATIHLTGRDEIALWINGEPLEPLYFATRWLRADILDITRRLRPGTNSIVARAGSSRIAPQILAEIRGVYENWSEFRFATGGQGWQLSSTLTADWLRREQDGSTWRPVTVLPRVTARMASEEYSYEILFVEAPERAVAGQNIDVTFRWRVRAPASRPHFLRISLFHSEIWFKDSYFDFDVHPPDWAAGDLVTVRTTFVVPTFFKPGAYEVRIWAPGHRATPPDAWPTTRVESTAPGFSTALLPEADCTFAVIADTHYTSNTTPKELGIWQRHLRREITDRVLRSVDSLHPEFVLHLGDMVAGFPRLGNFDQACSVAIDAFRNLACPVHFVPGNHDVGNAPYVPRAYARNPCDEAARQKYTEWFGPDWYHVDTEEIRLLVVNNNLCGTDSAAEHAQFTWLQTILEERTDKPLVVAAHIPFFQGSPERTADGGSYESIGQPQRDRWLELLERHRPAIVYTGHTHFEATHTLDGVTHYTVPSATFTRAHYPWCSFSPKVMAVCEDKVGFHVARVYGDRLVSNVVFPFEATELPATLQADNSAPTRRLVGRKAVEIENGRLGLAVAQIPDAYLGDGAKTGTMDNPWHAPAQTGAKWVLIEDEVLDFRYAAADGTPRLPDRIRRALTTGRAEGVRYIVSFRSDPAVPGDRRFEAYVSALVDALHPLVHAFHLARGSTSDRAYHLLCTAARARITPRSRFVVSASAFPESGPEADGDALLLSWHAEDPSGTFDHALGAPNAPTASTKRTTQRFVRLQGWSTPTIPFPRRQERFVDAYLAAHRVGIPVIFAPGTEDDYGLLDAALNPLPLWSTFRTLSTLFEVEGTWQPVSGQAPEDMVGTTSYRRTDGIEILPIRARERRTVLPDRFRGALHAVDPLTGCIQKLVSRRLPGGREILHLARDRMLFVCSDVA